MRASLLTDTERISSKLSSMNLENDGGGEWVYADCFKTTLVGKPCHIMWRSPRVGSGVSQRLPTSDPQTEKKTVEWVNQDGTYETIENPRNHPSKKRSDYLTANRESHRSNLTHQIQKLFHHATEIRQLSHLLVSEKSARWRHTCTEKRE